MDGIPWLCEPIVSEAQLWASFHESRPAEVREVP